VHFECGEDGCREGAVQLFVRGVFGECAEMAGGGFERGDLEDVQGLGEGFAESERVEGRVM
jgi:hypothetical protein